MSVFKLLKALFFKKAAIASSQDEVTKSRAIILPRKFYLEEKLTLPLTKLSDIRKALKHTHIRNSPYPKSDFFFHIESSSEKSTQLTLYILKPEFTLPNKLTLVLPETLLFRSQSKKLTQITSLGETEYILHSPSGTTRNISPTTKDFDAFIKDHNLAKIQTETIDQQNWSAKAQSAYNQLNLKNFQGLLHNPNGSGLLTEKNRKYLIYSTAALLVLHTVNISLQYFFISQQMTEVKAQKKKFRSAISMRQATENKTKKLEESLSYLRQQLGANHSAIAYLQTLKKPLEKFSELRITSIELQTAGLKVNITAKDATDILDSFEKTSDVKSISFVGGIRKNKDNTQSFTLNISFKEPAS